ncbi:MAG: nicotinate-nucleotide adenylyltransferase [Nitratireductor sp.]
MGKLDLYNLVAESKQLSTPTTHNSITKSDKSIMRDAIKLPAIADGMRIGLFGGSFNPPHAGHVHVSQTALIKGKLDQVWWLVTPGNPLKDTSQLASLTQRLKKCHELIKHPKIKVSAIEAKYNLRYTQQTLALLKKLCPRINFVWIMGADNLKNFHQWQNWREIANQMPIMIIDRPGSTLSYRSAQAAIALSKYRIDETDAHLLANMKAPAWAFIHGPRNSLSSTAIRNKISNNAKKHSN